MGMSMNPDSDNVRVVSMISSIVHIGELKYHPRYVFRTFLFSTSFVDVSIATAMTAKRRNTKPILFIYKII